MKMTSRFALVAAAATLFGAYSANAADLGGGCCADLEERVAELEATTARKGNRVVSLQVYGSVNQEIVYYDADSPAFGSSDDVIITDDETSRFGFRGSATLKPGFSAGYRIELATDGEQGGDLGIRQNNVWIEGEQLGRLTIGNQSTATDGVANISLGNVYSDSASAYDGSYNTAPGIDVEYSNFDGGREDAIRYDSPSVAGFIFSAAWTNDVDGTSDEFDSDEFWDIALRYSGEFNAFRLAAAIGYAVREDGTDEDIETTIGSVSIMHVPTGIFGAFQAGEREQDESEEFWYAQLGIEKQWLSYGATTLYGEYGEFDSTGLVALEGDVEYWGIGATQSFDAAAMDIYVLYRDIEEDAGDEVQHLTVGTKISF